MSAVCLRWLLGPGPASLLLPCAVRRVNPVLSGRWARSGSSPFTTTTGDTTAPPPPPKKKPDPRARVTVGSVGRKIHQRHLQVISETGEDLGVMHRAAVLRVMDEKGLKLVSLDESKEPPVFRLMTGKQIHQEQLRLREEQKSKAAPVQVKELRFSVDIAPHDLVTKLKQVQSWLDKRHHVRITLRSRHGEHAHLDTALEQMVRQIEVKVGFVTTPRVTQEGRAAMCVLRPPSAKELAQKGPDESATAQNPASPAANNSPAAPSPANPSPAPDTT